jgi:hypothetical protein
MIRDGRRFQCHRRPPWRRRRCLRARDRLGISNPGSQFPEVAQVEQLLEQLLKASKNPETRTLGNVGPFS